MSQIEEKYKDVETQQLTLISLEEVQGKVKKLTNWKAPGKDGIHNYWIKKLTSLHPILCVAANKVIKLEDQNALQWLLDGRTTLIHKQIEGNCSHNPSNYRPITCLSNIWKLISGIINDKIYDHLIRTKLFPEEQMGCKKNVLGTKDQLLLNKAIMEDAVTNQRNLAMVWIDYQKAYDSVPHQWLVKTLELLKVNGEIITFLNTAMQHYRTTLIYNQEDVGEVKIRRGIFQGDALSPLMFVMALFPLTHLLQSTKKGYRFSNTDKYISHLWYVDDLKLFAKNERDMKKMVSIVEAFSQDIGMSFGIDKCKWVQIHRGKLIEAEEIQTRFGNIQNLFGSEKNYKYLGILEKQQISKVEMKELVSKEYKRRVKLILQSALNSKNLMTAINSYAVPVVRYSASILDWSKEKLENMDRATRKWLALAGVININSDVDRMYIPRKLGGKGLLSIKDTVVKELNLVSNYLNNAHPESNLRQCRIRRKKSATAQNLASHDEQIQPEDHMGKLMEKKLHGEYFREMKKENTENYEWVRIGHFKRQTEALLMAAQENALRLNYIKCVIDKTRDNPLCRMCEAQAETVQHILCGCRVLANTDYLERHNRVGNIIHWALARKWGFETAPKYYQHEPKSVLDNDKIKILWDFPIRTDRTVHSQRPDLVIIYKGLKKAQIVDFSIPIDTGVKRKTQEKICKYSDLRIELRRIWNLQSIEILPIIIGALGAMTRKEVKENLAKLEIADQVGPVKLQQETLLGSARILRKVLSY